MQYSDTSCNHLQTGIQAIWRMSSGFGAVLLAASVAGCGGSAPQPAPAQQQAAAPVAPMTGAPTTGAETAPASQDSGTKWLGKVPYDVYYNAPLDKVGVVPELGAAVVTPANVAASAVTTPAPTATMNSAADSADAAPAAAGKWSTAITPELLDAESKVIRTRLTQSLQSVSTYNRSIDSIGADAIILSALAGVAERFDKDMRWKERAPAVRTLAYTVYENVGGKGRKAFDDTRAPFEQIVSILDGGPTDGVDAEADVPMADYADRSSLMGRMKSSFEWMRGNIASEATLKSEQDDAVREAAVLAMIGEIIKQEGYDYHEEENYKKFCNEYTTAAIDARVAAEELNFDAFQDAVARIQTSCGNCHGEYAFGDDGL